MLCYSMLCFEDKNMYIFEIIIMFLYINYTNLALLKIIYEKKKRFLEISVGLKKHKV